MLTYNYEAVYVLTGLLEFNYLKNTGSIKITVSRNSTSHDFDSFSDIRVYVADFHRNKKSHSTAAICRIAWLAEQHFGGNFDLKYELGNEQFRVIEVAPRSK